MELGYEKGEICNRDKCKGILEENETNLNCSCHINPPCSYCTDSRIYCPVCGWDGRDEQIEEVTKTSQSQIKDYNPFKPKKFEELNRSRIDYLSLAHTHFSMIKKGVFPKGTTIQEVEELVKGTFGGRFKYFNENTCEFEYVAYTD